MTIAAGNAVPEARLTVMTNQGPTPISSTELLGKGLIVLFAVPGPFTPTCSARHLPGFMEQYQALTERGVNQVVCMAVSDIFVMEAWRKASGADAGITMAADGNGDFTRALGLELDASAFGMGKRSQRFALIIRDGKVDSVLLDGPGEFQHSSAESVLDHLN
jgi:glutaredoxin/glutathione-dependent peroxiredoxin